MILLAVQGGLGNQLFQYAFARALSLERAEPIWIDQSRYFDAKRAQIRRLELPGLATKIGRILPPEVSAFSAGNQGRFVFEGLAFERHLDEGQSPTNIAPIVGNMALKGEFAGDVRYLQDPAFLNILREEFAPRVAPTSPAYMQALSQISAAKSPVCVQVRRGEYKRMTHLFAYLNTPYYHAARAIIAGEVADPSWFIFSDEPDHVAQEMAPCRGVTILPPLHAIESLDLARRCHHYICANSTFSWWSALLSCQPQGLTVVPKDYFTQPDAQAEYAADQDFYPVHWIRA